MATCWRKIYLEKNTFGFDLRFHLLSFLTAPSTTFHLLSSNRFFNDSNRCQISLSVHRMQSSSSPWKYHMFFWWSQNFGKFAVKSHYHHHLPQIWHLCLAKPSCFVQTPSSWRNSRTSCACSSRKTSLQRFTASWAPRSLGRFSTLDWLSWPNLSWTMLKNISLVLLRANTPVRPHPFYAIHLGTSNVRLFIQLGRSTGVLREYKFPTPG